MNTRDHTAPTSEKPAELSARALFVCFLIAMMGATIGLRTLGFIDDIGNTKRDLVDFDMFRIVGTMAWDGTVAQAYRAESFAEILATYGSGFGTWTYPPPFCLVVAPLAFLPTEIGFALFMAATSAAYLIVLSRIAGRDFVLVLALTFPSIFMTIACGQNGFLVGALAGWACLAVLAGRASAGVPLGLMVVKPHLAAGFALAVLAGRRWQTVAVTAGIVAFCCGAATIAFRPAIWPAFAHATGEARHFLETGHYPLFRMISAYASARTLGAPVALAMAIQAMVAFAALASIAIAVRARMSTRQVFGLSAIAGLMVSPYAYDYDLSILGIGLALLAPDLRRLASRREFRTLLGASGLASSWGLIQTFVISKLHGAATRGTGEGAVSLAAPLLILVLVLVWRILRRDRAAAPSARHSPELAAA